MAKSTRLQITLDEMTLEKLDMIGQHNGGLSRSAAIALSISALYRSVWGDVAPETQREEDGAK